MIPEEKAEYLYKEHFDYLKLSSKTEDLKTKRSAVSLSFLCVYEALDICKEENLDERLLYWEDVRSFLRVKMKNIHN